MFGLASLASWISSVGALSLSRPGLVRPGLVVSGQGSATMLLVKARSKLLIRRLYRGLLLPLFKRRCVYMDPDSMPRIAFGSASSGLRPFFGILLASPGRLYVRSFDHGSDASSRDVYSSEVRPEPVAVSVLCSVLACAR